MTAWIAIVAPICVLTKCGIDFIGLEYGNQLQPISDGHFFAICAYACGLALLVDLFNCLRAIK